jgi:PAS domain-containing protein
MADDDAALVDAMAGAVVAADEQGRIAHMNEGARNLFRFETPPVGESLLVLAPTRIRRLHARDFERIRSTGVGHLLGRRVRAPALRGDGTEMEVEITLRMLTRPEGSSLIVASVVDSTHAPKAGKDVLELETRLARRAHELI